MSNQILGKNAINEIHQSMEGLNGADSSFMANILAERFSVSRQHIYKLTKHLRPENKPRSDKGKRKFKLVEGSDLFTAASLVIGGKLDPDQAILTCQANGLTNLPSVQYFQRILRENGLSGKQRKSSKRPFRFWEAESPGELYQIDVTALKVRWEDIKTRRILRIEGIDKNHPNLDDKKIRVWQIMAVDDHSRRRFLRYVATTHITSLDMVMFVCELFDAWGVAKIIYTDNGSEFKGYFSHAEKILNKILENDGGFVHKRHLPGNSQASGKVEVAHKWAEKMDRYIGLAVSRKLSVTIDNLNPFADEICNFYNNRVHRSTGETPNARWFSKRIVVRKLPLAIIQSALTSDQFETLIDDSNTFSHKGIVYRVPGVQPFVNYAGTGQKVQIVVPQNIDFILLTLPDKSDWQIEKIIATADKAGDYKSHAESNSQQLTKKLKAAFEADNKTAAEKLKQTGEITNIPHFNFKIEQPETNVANFPHQEIVFSAEEVAAVAPVPPSLMPGHEISYWEAVSIFKDKFTDIQEAKEFLATLFGAGEVITESEVEAAIEDRYNYQQKPTRLRAVK